MNAPYSINNHTIVFTDQVNDDSVSEKGFIKDVWTGRLRVKQIYLPLSIGLIIIEFQNFRKWSALNW